MDELPCYTEPDEFEYKDNCDPCETVSETYPNEVVNVSADNLHSIIHGACHEQSEHIEEYGTRKPGESSNLDIATSIATGLTMVNAVECGDMSIIGKESLRGMRFTLEVSVRSNQIE
ncbi:hypothetical protein J1N35_022117 [Gossypium stocksii]|uniref:Uncharacterized protein n=1 Tax=Gossypium stocksii TaxID=47602 RepID=A0A9D4A0U4_9ROSI|nr:hypothetical protein J1N35_022117 [Gossypium stocksii]